MCIKILIKFWMQRIQTLTPMSTTLKHLNIIANMIVFTH